MSKLEIICPEFLELFPFTPNKELAKHFHVSLATIQRVVGRLSLTKDEDYLTNMYSERARGKVKSEITKDRIRQKALGRTWKIGTKEKFLATKIKNDSFRKGDKSPHWKGGKTWERFKNPDYIAWRKSVLERDGYVCQGCKRQCRKSEKGLAAHHIKGYAKYPELRFDINNGITMCRKCHMALHGRPLKDATLIPCACGCRTMIFPFDKYGGRPRKYVNFHGTRGRTQSEAAKQALSRQRKGKPLSLEHRDKISKGLRNSQKRIGRPRNEKNEKSYLCS